MPSLIKNKTTIPENEEIIYSTSSLDYIITLNIASQDVYCYGNKRTNLIPFLVPGVVNKLSAETGEFIKNNESLHEVSTLFNLEDNKVYYILRLLNNDEELNNIFFFEYLDDILNFTGTLQMLALKFKTEFLRSKNDTVWLRICSVCRRNCFSAGYIEFQY